MAKNLKQIVQEIQKIAAPPPPPPTGYAGTTTTTHRVPSPSGTATPTQGIAAVQEMQRAMQGLADAVMRDAGSATMAHKPGDALQPSATKEVANAKKGFNDFIAEQYLGGLDEDKKGVEWSTDKAVTTVPAKQQTQTDIYELDAVMDTFRRIGMGKSEFNDDGRWGPRTDNALRNIMGFAYALLQLENDLGLKNPVYTYDAWKAFSRLLSGYTVEGAKISLTPEEQAERAKAIIPHLKAITNMYTHQFRSEVLAKPEFRPLLEGKRSFEKYETTGTSKDALTPQEDALSKAPTAKITGMSFRAPGLPGGKIDNVPLYALRSKDDFNKFLKYLGWTDENIEAGIGAKLLQIIKQQLASK